MLRYDVKVDPRDAIVLREERHLDHVLPWPDDENVLVLEHAAERVPHLGLTALQLAQHLAGQAGNVFPFALPECEKLPRPANHSESAVAV